MAQATDESRVAQRSGERTVVIWICPDCGNYYASSSAGDLSTDFNKKLNSGQPTFARSKCPDCPGEVHRERVVVRC